MSYQKVSSSTGNGTIQFYYLTSTLFNELKQRTAYRSKDLMGQDGVSQFDKFAMMDDDEPMFDTFLEYAVPTVFKDLARISNGVTDSVFIDAAVDQLGDGSGFSLVDYEAYDDNILTVLDNKIREAIVHYILKEWWSVRGLDAENQKADAVFQRAIIAMKESAWALIKPLMS